MDGDVKKIRSAAYKGYADGSVDFFGNQIENITKYSKDEFLSRSVKWVDIVHKEDLPIFKEIFKQALKTDKTYMREYRIITRDGVIRWIQEWGQIVCDSEGKVEYVIGVVLDVTEQKKEEEIKRRISQRTGRYLTFKLGQNEFGISINSVKEIVGQLTITPLPSSPDYVPGVINLRGKVLPVLDLRRYYGFSKRDKEETASLIITEYSLTGSTLWAGMRVDEVCDVLFIKGDVIEEKEDFFTHSLPKGIWGIAKIDKRMILLLDAWAILKEVFGKLDMASLVQS